MSNFNIGFGITTCSRIFFNASYLAACKFDQGQTWYFPNNLDIGYKPL